MPWTPLNGNVTNVSASAHYRLVAALSEQEKLCSTGSKENADFRREISLKAIATAMDMPVVLATYHCENGIPKLATHGLGLMDNIATFAAACNDLCADQAIAIPNIKSHSKLGPLTQAWEDQNICFLVGVPLRNGAGQLVGSLVVMNSQKVVARSGISFKALNAFGKAFAQNSRIPTVVLKQ